MHFGTKNYLKSTRNHTAKHTLNQLLNLEPSHETSRVLQLRKSLPCPWSWTLQDKSPSQ